MTVYECMEMLGRHTRVRIFDGSAEITREPLSAYEYEMYAEEYPRHFWDAVIEKEAKSVDLVNMVIYCGGI